MKQCEVTGEHTSRKKCCGIYPNRYPYNSDQTACCREKRFLDDDTTEIFSIVDANTCKNDLGGEVVESEKGKPHSYFVKE